MLQPAVPAQDDADLRRLIARLEAMAERDAQKARTCQELLAKLRPYLPRSPETGVPAA
jgi:hypothetical protein